MRWFAVLAILFCFSCKESISINPLVASSDNVEPEIAFAVSKSTATSGETVVFEVSATDNVDGVVKVELTCDAGMLSGSALVLPIVSNVTEIFCTATAEDKNGNVGQRRLVITVTPVTAGVEFSLVPSGPVQPTQLVSIISGTAENLQLADAFLAGRSVELIETESGYAFFAPDLPQGRYFLRFEANGERVQVDVDYSNLDIPADPVLYVSERVSTLKSSFVAVGFNLSPEFSQSVLSDLDQFSEAFNNLSPSAQEVVATFVSLNSPADPTAIMSQLTANISRIDEKKCSAGVDDINANIFGLSRLITVADFLSLIGSFIETKDILTGKTPGQEAFETSFKNLIKALAKSNGIRLDEEQVAAIFNEVLDFSVTLAGGGPVALVKLLPDYALRILMLVRLSELDEGYFAMRKVCSDYVGLRITRAGENSPIEGFPNNGILTPEILIDSQAQLDVKRRDSLLGFNDISEIFEISRTIPSIDFGGFKNSEEFSRKTRINIGLLLPASQVFLETALQRRPSNFVLTAIQKNDFEVEVIDFENYELTFDTLNLSQLSSSSRSFDIKFSGIEDAGVDEKAAFSLKRKGDNQGSGVPFDRVNYQFTDIKDTPNTFIINFMSDLPIPVIGDVELSVASGGSVVGQIELVNGAALGEFPDEVTSYRIVSGSGPNLGVVTPLGANDTFAFDNGRFTYNAQNTTELFDSFQYQAFNSKGESNLANVEISISQDSLPDPIPTCDLQDKATLDPPDGIPGSIVCSYSETFSGNLQTRDLSSFNLVSECRSLTNPLIVNVFVALNENGQNSSWFTTLGLPPKMYNNDTGSTIEIEGDLFFSVTARGAGSWEGVSQCAYTNNLGGTDFLINQSFLDPS